MFVRLYNALTLVHRLQAAFPKLADVFNREVEISRVDVMPPLIRTQDTPSARQPEPKSAAARTKQLRDRKWQLHKYKTTANALLNTKTCKFTFQPLHRVRHATVYSTIQGFPVRHGLWSVKGVAPGKYGFYREDGQWGMKFTADKDGATHYKHPASPKVHAEIVTEVAKLKKAYYKTDSE
jgi:hypothetical protein